MSGFSAVPRGNALIWHTLEARGVGHAIMNVAFRNDPVWSGIPASLDFGCDSYRLWSKPAFYRLDSGRQEHEFRGISFRTLRRKPGIAIAQEQRGAGIP